MTYKKQEWIAVEEGTIATASCKDSAHCMIADAIKKAMPHVSGVSVDLQTIRLSDRKAGKRYVYLTPSLCQVQLLRFDQGEVVEPWSFRLPCQPSQVIPIKSQTAARNTAGRPTANGPKTITEKVARNIPPVVKGGEAPPFAVLAHSPASGRNPGRKRVFGIRAAGSIDGPWRNRED
jgi:hypothetical protein